MRALIAAIALTTLSGCASILSDQVYPVSVTSSPNQASYEVKDQDGIVVAAGTTPDTLKLSANAGFFDGELYTFNFQKDGYSDATFTLNSGVDGWYWGNILFGGILGMLIVDPATGAMFDLPRTAAGSLKPITVSAAPSPTRYYPAPVSSTDYRARKLEELMDKNLPYEEYQRQYKQITGE